MQQTSQPIVKHSLNSVLIQTLHLPCLWVILWVQWHYQTDAFLHENRQQTRGRPEDKYQPDCTLLWPSSRAASDPQRGWYPERRENQNHFRLRDHTKPLLKAKWGMCLSFLSGVSLLNNQCWYNCVILCLWQKKIQIKTKDVLLCVMY